MDYPIPPSEPIALVGSSCRFAGGASSPSKLWEVLSNPADLSKRVPSSRFSAEGFFHDDPEYHGTTNSPHGYWLEQDHRVFDAAFFNITPKEAEAIDPQQRLLLEVVYEGLESAGYTIGKYAGKNVGVYAGVMTADYHTLSERDELNASQYSSTGNSRAIIANRLSYFFDFHGPSMTIDTACSASLVALHQAVLSLRSREIDMACVAGANLILTPEQFLAESDLHMLSPSGHSRMWDAKADGYARGEGIAACFIKTLSRALADGDTIQAIIRETGVNSDGRTKGITVPNPEAQRALIQSTYNKSNLNPFNPDHRPQYFEAHGTGTPVGDPREARAIAEAFFCVANTAQKQQHQPKLVVGSLKTIIGHTEGAAGLAGVLKVVQSMNNHTIPANLHLDTLNPGVRPFYENLEIPTEQTPWPLPPSDQPYRASVNSFGFGGTNAHAIIERYEPRIHNVVAPLFDPKAPDNTLSLANNTMGMFKQSATSVSTIVLPLLFSAASEKSLIASMKKYLAYVSCSPQVKTEQLAWHLYNQRTAHAFRVSLGPGSGDSATQTLSSWIDKTEKTSSLDTATIIRSKQLRDGPRILGIFTGQGAHYAMMSKGLFQTSTVYRDAIEALDAVLTTCDDPPTWTLQQQILTDEQDSRVGVAEVTQPLCTALQIALVDLLASIGISFHTIVGHSSGEIAAAYAAGRLTRRDAILISYYRGRYAHLASGINGGKGAMMACGISKHEADEFCSKAEYKGKIYVAASNSPTLVTLSGDVDAVTAAFDDLRSRGKFAKQLNIDTAYHSFHMLKSVEAYSKALEKCDITPHTVDKKPQWISSVYACSQPIDAKELALKYWGENMINPVLFHEAVTVALEQCDLFDCAIEVGPHPAMKSAVTETMKKTLKTALPYHGLLHRGKEGGVAFAEFLGFMWSHFGPTSVGIRSFIENSSQPELLKSRLDDAPTYAWDHSQVHLRESRLASQYHNRQRAPHELLGVRTRDDNQFELRWRNVLKLDKIPWVEGHKFQGQALLPASAYCVMALDAAKVVLNGRPASMVELWDLEFLSGITIEPDTLGVETLFTVSVVSSGQTVDDQGQEILAGFTLTSVPVTSFNFAPMRLNFQGRMRIVLEDPSLDVLPSRSEEPLAEMLPANVDAFYRMMDGIGLSYTGPFKALNSIDRRFNYARASLSLRHEADTTRLDVSPATLDTCLQSTFVTFSSPGDKALWTSFLPTNIAKLQFNLANCGTPLSPAAITVESHLTKLVPFDRGSPATITADLHIFDERGHSMLQIEGLTVSSFANTRPDANHELYLHTVMDLDPEFEFVTAPIGYETPRPGLVESCERVAQFYMDQPATTLGLVDTPPLSPIESFTPDSVNKSQPSSEVSEEQLSQFILESPYFNALQFIRETGRWNHQAPRSLLPSVIQDAQLLHDFGQHLGKVIRQIAHRFPRMDVLDLTSSEWAFTENIVDGLQDTFRSYHLPGDPLPRNLSHRCPSLHGNKKVSFADLDLNGEPAAMAVSPGTYDLVILSTSAVSRFHSSHVSIVQKLRRLMKNRGFIVLVHAPVSLFHDQAAEVSASEQRVSDASVSMAPLWAEVLNSHDFLPPARHSEQKYPHGMCFVIRQVPGGDEMDFASPVLTDKPQDENVLIVGGEASRLQVSCEQLRQEIPGRTMTVWSVGTIEEITPEEASAYTSVLFLADLTRPLCTSMTDSALAVLKALMQPGKAVLWVTSNALHNPERAASLGLTRTLKAEIPNLILQVLDLDEPPSFAALVATQFARLLQYREYLRLPDEVRSRSPVSLEPEIHIEDGKRLIPRVLPFRPAIERLNAYRRDVSNTYNSLETCVLIDNVGAADGRTRFEARIAQDTDQAFVGKHAESILVHVEYNSLLPLLVKPSQQQYFCIGKDVESDRWVAGISGTLGSTVPVFEARDLSPHNLDRRNLAALLSPMITALFLADWGGNRSGNILLIEPDPTLLLCLRWVLPPGLATEYCSLHVWTSSQDLAKENCDVKYVHPQSSARELKQALPGSSPTILDFSPKQNRISRVVEGLPEVAYVRWPCSSLCAELQWTAASQMSIHLATLQPSQDLSATFMTPAQLLGTNDPIPPFTVVDWKADRLVSIPVKPIVESRLLHPDRTYILVGLTRDLGQSLCRLFIQHGAQSLVVASRNPDKSPVWVSELNSEGANIRVERMDVTNLEDVKSLKARIVLEKEMPPVGGIVNGAMVLDDRVFAKMDNNTWERVMRPKTVGSKNLDAVFDDEKLEFFIMTSSFAAPGGHAGQSNYAAANMYMNGLAVNRRRRGLAGSVLNIGVIYGLGLLAREKQGIYTGLEKEGYPPISERDIHHMFLEAIVAGRPVPGQIMDLTTGLARYHINDPNPLHWHRDRRFCHFTVDDDVDDGGSDKDSGAKQLVKELIGGANTVQGVLDIVVEHFCRYLEVAHQLPGVTRDNSIVELGLDSLAAVEIRNWFYKSVGRDVAVMKIVGSSSILSLCDEIAKKIVEDRN
ncbi:hypothetical protein VMCG_05341 [Cytospora schulzeri]|uniref:Uncharacterized protein n=1 Tax=Cytospora schulzeri TaxID=448051 RepID=A0A423WK51_9PEZI|nr:hypothetical protein VMCG_05341 [Valsa malicola]